MTVGEVMPGWWNGRHTGLKSPAKLILRGGSSPLPGTRHRGVAQLVERCFWEAEVMSSNLVTPT